MFVSCFAEQFAEDEGKVPDLISCSSTISSSVCRAMEVPEPKGTVTSEKEKAQRVWRRTSNVRLGPNGHIFDPQVKHEHVLGSYLSSRLSEKEGEVRRQKGRVEKKSVDCGLWIV